MPTPLVTVVRFATSPTGRRVFAYAVRAGRTKEGRKLIAQVRKVATSPEGRKLIKQVKAVVKQPAETPKAGENRTRVEAIRSRLRSRKP